MRPLASLLIALFALSPIAYAGQDHGFHVGAGAGRITVSGSPGSSIGYQGFVGCDFSRFLALETVYLDAGGPSAGPGHPDSGLSPFAPQSVSGAQVSLLGKIPLSRSISLFGRVGGIFWRDESQIASFTGLGSYSHLETGLSFAWGSGGEVSLGHFAVRAEFQQAHINTRTEQFVNGSLIYRF